MSSPLFKRIPRHIGVIPDGNRRWAVQNGLRKEQGYSYGIDPGFKLYQDCLQLGIEEMTFYGFTQDNTKRPAIQRIAFQKACVNAVLKLAQMDASLLVVGNTDSPLFPVELLPFASKRVTFGNGRMKVNFLVNYGWQWDLGKALSIMSSNQSNPLRTDILGNLGSKDISKIDLIIRWGGRRRLSGFLPVQTIYADFYIIDDLWPDYTTEHLYDALHWYEEQDITLGG
ncbi:MAG: undecaprenyl diphosphate synthase family protein [Peptococcaceae bacterium]|jgi:undecaprenyl diphosphate synthase|nr:undecaprenyl diphosphate synthase family protein [Peptococcaceae bacterium]MDH7524141.1 undecaprenyl diphosphate synthase family protein [Peptococcaceae bacterium]